MLRCSCVVVQGNDDNNARNDARILCDKGVGVWERNFWIHVYCQMNLVYLYATSRVSNQRHQTVSGLIINKMLENSISGSIGERSCCANRSQYALAWMVTNNTIKMWGTQYLNQENYGHTLQWKMCIMIEIDGDPMQMRINHTFDNLVIQGDKSSSIVSVR